jgi:isocitrate dehydrogenase
VDEVLAGQKAYDETGDWLPEATLDAFRSYLVGIKGRSRRRSAAASAA